MQVGGPQEERTKRLFRDNVEAPMKEKEFVVPVDFRVQEETYQEKFHAQHEEIQFLKNYIERILNQLRRVLVKHDELEQLQSLCDPMIAHVNPAEDDETHSLVSPPWFTSKEYMSPLFAAYESRIKELEGVCEKYRTDIDSFASQVHTLAADNDRLQQELTSALEKLILQSESKSTTDFYASSKGADPLGDKLAELNERLDILMSENSLLVEQVSLQESELEECQKDIQERDNQLLTMSQNFNQASVAIQELRETCEHLKNDKKRCEVQIQQFAGTIAQLEAQKENIGLAIENHKANEAKYKKQIEEYELTLATIKRGAEQKQTLVTKRYQGVCERLRELTSALDSKDRQVDEWQERHRAASTELDLVKHDCEGMVKVMQSMEKQLNEYAAREEAVAELERSTLDKAQAAMLERDQAIAKETQCRREIARLLEQKRVAASENLKATDEAVEKAKRKQVISETATRLQADAEKQVKECTAQQDARFKAFQDKYQTLVDRLAQTELIRDDAIAQEAKIASILVTKELQFEKTLAEIADKLKVEHEQVSGLQRELDVRRSELREAQESNAAKEKHVAMMTKEVEDVRNEWSQKNKYQLDMYAQQVRDLKGRLELSESEIMKLKHEATKTEQTLRLDYNRMEAKFKHELEVSSHRCSRLKDEKTRVEAQLMDLQAKYAIYATKIIGLEQELADAHHQCSQWQMHIEEAERKSADIGSQLALVLSSQQQNLRADVELKSTLDRTKLEKSRLEREIALLRKTIEDQRQRATTQSSLQAKDASPHSFYVPVDKLGT
ncbi:unnamed protein product [Aphanomyces euteiches]